MRIVSASQLKSMLDQNQNMHLLNVLPQDTFHQKHIPGSLNVPFAREKGAQEFVQEVQGRVKDPQAVIVVYCAIRECDLSPQAAKRLEDAGFRNVVDFEGGLSEWEQSGLELQGEAV